MQRVYFCGALAFGLMLSCPATAQEVRAPLQTLVTHAPSAPISSAATPAITIDVAAIEAPSVDELGVLTEKEGGLPYTIWKGSSYASAAPLLSWIKSGVANEKLRNLVTSLLLSQAAAPEGSKGDWLVYRAKALVALGAEDKAEQLLAAVPTTLATQATKQLRAELLLLREETASACEMAETEIAKATGDDSIFWQKLRIICKAQAGKKDEANLALDLLRETHTKDEAFLQDILHAFSDKSFQMKALPTKLSIMEFCALRMANEIDKVKDKLDALPPVTLKYMLTLPKLDTKLREKVESKAILTGMLPQTSANKLPPLTFAAPLASDITTLVNALGSGEPPNEADEAVIARLDVDTAAATLDTRRVQRLLSLMEVFGYKVPPTTWEKLFSRKGRYDGDIPPATLIDKLTIAAHEGRKAEAIVLCALILEAADIEKMHEVVLLPVIKALHKMGYTKEARSLAYDAVQSYRAP